MPSVLLSWSVKAVGDQPKVPTEGISLMGRKETDRQNLSVLKGQLIIFDKGQISVLTWVLLKATRAKTACEMPARFSSSLTHW